MAPKPSQAKPKKAVSKTIRRGSATRASSSAARARAKGMGASQKARTKLDLAAFQAMLVAEQARLTKELDELEARTARRAKLDAAIEEQDFDDNPTDAATETLDRGTDLALEANLQDLLDKIAQSLAKVQDSTYGICDSCGRDISERRLRALPYATLCIECQGRLESQ